MLASAEDANQGQELGGCLERAAPTDHAGEMDAQAAAALQAAGQACAGAQAAVDFHLALVVKVTPEQGEEVRTPTCIVRADNTAMQLEHCAPRNPLVLLLHRSHSHRCTIKACYTSICITACYKLMLCL